MKTSESYLRGFPQLPVGSEEIKTVLSRLFRNNGICLINEDESVALAAIRSIWAEGRYPFEILPMHEVKGSYFYYHIRLMVSDSDWRDLRRLLDE